MLVQDTCLAVLPVKVGDCEKHSLWQIVELPTGAVVKSRQPREGDQEGSATHVKCSEQFLNTAFCTVLFIVLLMCFKHLVGNYIKDNFYD